MGGLLAIGGHGTSIPASGESRAVGQTFGSVSNLVLSMRAIVWDASQGAYVMKEFGRDTVEGAALAVHLGRALVTDVTLRVGRVTNLRCRSYTSIPGDELLGPPGAGGRSVASFLDSAGRMEVIWFPFTDAPWFKVWSRAANLPWGSRWVFTPYNYPFSDAIPDVVTSLIGKIQTGSPQLTPDLGKLQLSIVRTGLGTSLAGDLWGRSKNTMLYVRPTTLKMTANGYAILCARDNLQQILYDLTQLHQNLLAAYQARGQYPINGPLEIRVSGLDAAADAELDGAQPALLSAVRPVPSRPEWTCAVWFDVLTLPGTAGADEYYADLEARLRARFNGGDSLLRVEWSKGWGYTAAGGWTDSDLLSTGVPAAIDHGQPEGSRFADALAALDRLDPHRIYSSPLLDRLAP